jgi:hypothetical protein
MFYIACTRFNNATLQENMDYRLKNNEPAIYGAALKIRNIYPIGCLIFIIEMNNDTNKIEGIGLIKNNLVNNINNKIYQNYQYNRFIYKGKYWVSRETIVSFNSSIIDIFDKILFKGKTHLKCRTGITIITNKLLSHWNYEIENLKQQIKQLFIASYPSPFLQENPQETEEIIPIKRRKNAKK